MEGGEWRINIISQLQARNKHETSAFQDIITYRKLPNLFVNFSLFLECLPRLNALCIQMGYVFESMRSITRK